VTTVILSKAIYMSNAILMAFITEIEAQKTVNREGNNEQKRAMLEVSYTQLQTILQSHDNKNSM
jgi:hypothetical protein